MSPCYHPTQRLHLTNWSYCCIRKSLHRVICGEVGAAWRRASKSPITGPTKTFEPEQREEKVIYRTKTWFILRFISVSVESSITQWKSRTKKKLDSLSRERPKRSKQSHYLWADKKLLRTSVGKSPRNPNWTSARFVTEFWFWLECVSSKKTSSIIPIRKALSWRGELKKWEGMFWLAIQKKFILKTHTVTPHCYIVLQNDKVFEDAKKWTTFSVHFG